MYSREVACFQWGTNWILKYYLEGNDRLFGLVVRVPGYRSEGFGFDSRALQEETLVCLERGPLNLVSTTKELLWRNSISSGLESREYCHKDPSRWPRITLYPQIVDTNFADKRVSLLRTEAKNFFFPLLQNFLTSYRVNVTRRICNVISID
jgi:hypothetical protein